MLIIVNLFREEWCIIKKQNNLFCCLTGCNAPITLAAEMPNQPAPDKTQLCIRLPRALKARLLKLAKKRGVSLTELVEFLLHKQTKTVELTPDDYRKIARETERAKR